MRGERDDRMAANDCVEVELPALRRGRGASGKEGAFLTLDGKAHGRNAARLSGSRRVSRVGCRLRWTDGEGARRSSPTWPAAGTRRAAMGNAWHGARPPGERGRGHRYRIERCTARRSKTGSRMADNGMPRDWAERCSPSFATDPDVALFTADLDHVQSACRSRSVPATSRASTVSPQPSTPTRGVGTAATWAP